MRSNLYGRILCLSTISARPGVMFCTESFAQLTLVLWLGCALSYPLTAIGLPYGDAALNAADVWMGLDWRAYLHFVNDRPLLGALTWLAYRSMLLQLVTLILALVITSHFLRVQQYILEPVLN